MKRLILLTTISFLLLNNMYAQDNCKVIPEALQGTYSGGCKDGKADGQGKATGTDSYEGNFKNGMPDGEGIYTWSNQDVYRGQFKKGNLEGKGEMIYHTASGRDSSLAGYWKKNKYVGKYDKPYIINDRTTKVNRVEINISRKGEKAGTINVSSTQLSGSAVSALPSIPVLTDIVVITGQYNSKTTSNVTSSSVTRIQQMIFPFRARLSFSNGEMVDVTFNEQADYEVSISFL